MQVRIHDKYMYIVSVYQMHMLYILHFCIIMLHLLIYLDYGMIFDAWLVRIYSRLYSLQLCVILAGTSELPSQHIALVLTKPSPSVTSEPEQYLITTPVESPIYSIQGIIKKSEAYT